MNAYMNTNAAKPNPLRAFLAMPKGSLLLLLLALAAIASLHGSTAGAWINAAVAVGVAVVLDVAFAIGQERRRIFPDGAVLTGLIVALVLSAGVPWYQADVAAGLAILSKHLLQVKRRPIFNPAALGLLAAILLFDSGQSWWGGLAELPAWCVLFLLGAGTFITHRVNKFPQVLAFLGTYCALFLIAGVLHLSTAGDALRDPFIHSALFLAFFMLTDPPTSPAKYGDQVIFGVMAAVIGVADFLALGGLSYLLVGLLIANAWYAWRSHAARKTA